ncbi:MAG: AzlD domain-containing protein [Syntrophothermus sp.]
MSKWIWLVLGMALVTYLPRMLPLVGLQGFSLPPRVRRWLQNVPYAALGALIFPGILTVQKGHPVVGAAGGLAAVVLALATRNIIVTVLGSIGTVYAVKALLQIP